MRVRGLLVTVALTAPLLATVPTQAYSPAAGAPDPVRSVELGGTGVSQWPAYDAGIERFAIGTGKDTGGTVTVTASTADPTGTVRVDGHKVGNGATTTVDGLVAGDEVNVQITDTAGTTNQSFLYLPAQFPRIRAESGGAGPDAGMVLLGLASYLSDTAYQTAVDALGVPVYVSANPKNHDFKASGRGDGHFTVAHLAPGSTAEVEGYQIDELDGRFRRVATHTLDPVRSIGLRRKDTDFHDVELLPDGRAVLTGYQRREYAGGRTWLDAIIQVLDRHGDAVFTWSSKGRVKPSEAFVLGAKREDYAHLNAVQVQPNGDLVASFRNTGQVLRIATERRGTVRPGDVLWRLGGKRNQFRFVDDPYAGFCAQHDVRVLPNGHLLMFDNGSQGRTDGPLFPQTADMCPDPADPGGPRIARPQSRVAEYALDVEARTARLVWSHEVPDRYAAFAGSAQRLASGHTLVGWWNSVDPTSSAAPPFVSEVTRGGTSVWSLTAEGWFSYRADRAAVPDLIRPQVVGDASGYRCTDRGGSNLASCAGVRVDEGLRVTATDRAGNARTRTIPQ